jgi:hypothetical protein
MQESSSPVIAVITIGVAVAISVLVRQGRRQSRSTALAPRERIRPLAITLLDPVISVIIIGPFVGHFVAHSFTHLLAAIIGGLGGVALGYARARIMFVRAIKESKSVVLRRSGLEYGLVLILIILRSAQGSVERSSSPLAQSLVTALAGLALVEALARSGFIVKRYRDNVDTHHPMPLELEPPPS